MGVDDQPLDDKAKRMRDLLSSFYSQDPSSTSMAANNPSSRFATLDTINTPSFDADQYMNLLVCLEFINSLMGFSVPHQIPDHIVLQAQSRCILSSIGLAYYHQFTGSPLT